MLLGFSCAGGLILILFSRLLSKTLKSICHCCCCWRSVDQEQSQCSPSLGRSFPSYRRYLCFKVIEVAAREGSQNLPDLQSWLQSLRCQIWTKTWGKLGTGTCWSSKHRCKVSAWAYYFFLQAHQEFWLILVGPLSLHFPKFLPCAKDKLLLWKAGVLTTLLQQLWLKNQFIQLDHYRFQQDFLQVSILQPGKGQAHNLSRCF